MLAYYYRPYVTAVAVLLMNNKPVAADVSVDWSADLPRGSLRCAASGCAVRDIHTHADLGLHAGGFTARALAPLSSRQPRWRC